MENKKYTGKVIWFNVKRGLGFLAWEKEGAPQKDMFVHFSDISVEGFKSLNKDQMVEFEIGKNHNGIDKAINVVPAK